MAIPQEIEAMYIAEPRANLDYFQFSWLGNKDAPSTLSCFSGFVGFTDDKPPREIRAASLVKASILNDTLRSLNQMPLVVHTDREFSLWTLWGGHAIIEKSIAEVHFPEWIKGHPIVEMANGLKVRMSSVDSVLLNRAPSRRLRMQVLDRDKRRCMICGQRPTTNVHVELEAHHIRPWFRGGVTEESNLITLCSACHDGLNPHYDLSLFDMIGVDWLGLSRTTENYSDQVRFHQQHMKMLLSQTVKKC